VIRQKNGADTLYTLHTSRISGDLLLTNEELLRVASRRREVPDPGQKPFRGFKACILKLSRVDYAPGHAHLDEGTRVRRRGVSLCL